VTVTGGESSKLPYPILLHLGDDGKCRGRKDDEKDKREELDKSITGFLISIYKKVDQVEGFFEALVKKRWSLRFDLFGSV
jgi:hypothetical protein